MITIISASNRRGSRTIKVANNFSKILTERQVPHQFFSLENLPLNFLYPEMYKTKNPDFLKLEEEVIIPTTKFLFIVPEYNGSIPGVLKAFIDACEIKRCFWYKKAALVGLSDGRAGNLRGLDDLTNILNFMKILVMPNKLPISRVNDELNEAGDLINPVTISVINKQMDEFIAF